MTSSFVDVIRHV